MTLERIGLICAEDGRICRYRVVLSANARVFGSFKADEFKTHQHGMEVNATASGGNRLASGTGSNGAGAISTDGAGNAETAPKNVAMYPRLVT